MQPQDDSKFQLGRHNAGIIPAVVLIGIGALFLLNNLNIFHVENWTQFWPVLLIAVGLVRLVESQFSGGRLMGGIMIAVGGLLLVDTLGYVHLNWEDMWPVLLIGLGVLMLFNRLTVGTGPFFGPWGGAGRGTWRGTGRGAWGGTWSGAGMQSPSAGAPEMHEGMLNEFVMFGGVERKVTTDDFQGGQIAATFGGGEIDLRRAGIRGDSAMVEVNATFGGVEFKVPPNWIVISQIVAVFGGVENKTTQPPADIPGVKRLYIKGSAIFGGVTIKN